MWQAGILIIYLIHHAHTTWTTHSHCPALNQSVRCKSYPKFDQCQTDTNCPGGKICCPQKCGKECITPSLPIGNRPGCPVCLGTQAGTECPLCVHFQNLCNADTECKAGQLCCYNPSCGTWCNNKKPVNKPGQCPPNLPGSICPLFVRPGDCINDGSCPGKQKCCRQGCSSGCVDPGPICNQPDQVCAVFCPFGNVLDENNCPIFCKCKTGCAGNVEPKPLSSCGEGQQICPSRYQCTIPPEGGIGICCPYECPQVKCSEPCPYGFVIDANGCQTCECEPRCGAVCAISCPFGNVLDENNCPICECKTGCAGNVQPKPLTSCGSGQQRCPSQYQCNTPPLGGSGVCCPYVCPQIKCSRPCPNGYKYDVNGCQTCQCLPGSACEKDTPHGTCRLGPFPSTPCPAGSYCKDPYCCRIPCKFGDPHPSLSCGMVVGSNKCPAGYSCLGGPADEYFACCPDENKPTPDKCPKDRYPKSKCYVRRSCKNDSSCRGKKKCCKQGCQYKCVAPVY